MPPHRGGPTDLMDADISFPLHRLFDDCNLDHVPEDERMQLFKHRDLPHVKHYKAAVKIFGGPLSRKRVIIAPAMETNLRHRLGIYQNVATFPEAPKLTSDLQSQEYKDPLAYDKKEIQKEVEKDKEYQYKKWVQERQKFRNDLENMGLNEEWLQRKPKKTALEKRVLHRMKEEREPKVEVEPPKESTPSSAEITTIPSVKIPSPIGIRILEMFLKKNKMRLIDLFTQTDKDKNWKLSKEEMRNSIRNSRVPLSAPLLEDLVMSLDTNFDDSLDYREMARGLELWRQEKRENRRKELSRESTSVSSKSSAPASATQAPLQNDVPTEQEDNHDTKSSVNSACPKSAKSSIHSLPKSPRSVGQGSVATDHSNQETAGPDSEVKKDDEEAKRRIDSGKGSGHDSPTTARTQESRSSTPQYLQPPEQDTRPEQLILRSEEAMVDLRKRDREALKAQTQNRKMSPKKGPEEPGIIKIGDKAIDNHCMKSTLEGETAVMINKFRQLKLKEYYEINKMCQRQGLTLSKALLERVLLHPPDRQPGTISKKIKPPGAPLLSCHYADPPKRPRTPIEVKHKDKVRRTKSGKLLIDSRHKYPQRSSVAPTGTKETLSTGRAVIRRKVDCWMTFEEYDRLTSHLAIRYQQLHGATNNNAFWPGHLLDKVRLCMPPYDNPELTDKSHSLFSNISRSKSMYPGLQTENSAWPVNEFGCIQSGVHDPFIRKYTYL